MKHEIAQAGIFTWEVKHVYPFYMVANHDITMLLAMKKKSEGNIRVRKRGKGER